MFSKKYHLILFLIILAFSVFPLHGVEITFYDCNGEKLNPKKNKYAKKWNEVAENVVNNQDIIDCLPKNWKSSVETWVKYFKVEIIICKKKLNDPNDCGNQQEKYIIVPEENNSGCGCEEATVFHEFIHQAVPVQESNENDTNDRRIRGCEVLILTKFIKNCQDNPPAGDQCDCMDQQDNQSPCRDPFEPPPGQGKKTKVKTMEI
ncbi:MAG: hypothetical protein JSV88_07855 [Candidatus Aminicenantes bacterium]|nr:MAG: hypothetical protein JSV88_07855 [Candidatus Aminicenantes bacterium]